MNPTHYNELDLDALAGHIPELLVEDRLIYTLRDSVRLDKPTKENKFMASCSAPHDVPRKELDAFVALLAAAPALLAYALEAREVLFQLQPFLHHVGYPMKTNHTATVSTRLAALLGEQGGSDE